MKKIFNILLVLISIFTFNACGKAVEVERTPEYPVWYSVEGINIHSTDDISITDNLIKCYPREVKFKIIGVSSSNENIWEVYDSVNDIQGWCNRWYLSPTKEEIERIENEIQEENARIEAEEKARLARLIPGTDLTGTLIGSDFTVTTYTPDPSENAGSSSNCFGESLWNWLDQTVAVDRRVIPLKSWIYVEGIGKRQARDTGVLGHHIDVLTTSYGGKWTGRKVWLLDE